MKFVATRRKRRESIHAGVVGPRIRYHAFVSVPGGDGGAGNDGATWVHDGTGHNRIRVLRPEWREGEKTNANPLTELDCMLIPFPA